MKNNVLYKYELAQLLEISTRTLARWLNERYLEALVKLGYTKKQKYLNRCQLNFLSEKLGLDL